MLKDLKAVGEALDELADEIEAGAQVDPVQLASALRRVATNLAAQAHEVDDLKDRVEKLESHCRRSKFTD